MGADVRKAVVLAAGIGKRMRPLTYHRPKPMVYLLNKPLVQHVVEGLRDAGIEEILLVVGYMREVVERHFEDGSSLGVKISYILQEKQLGTGHAARIAEDFVGKDDFLLTFGDIIVPPATYMEELKLFIEKDADAVVGVNPLPVEKVKQGASVIVDEEGRLVDIEEKPENPKSNLNNSGVFVFKNKVFEYIRNLKLSSRGEYELTDAIKELAKGGNVYTYRIEGYWSDVGRPSSLMEMTKFLLGTLGRKYVAEPTSHIGKGAILENVTIADGATVGSGAVLKDVILLPDSHVGAGAVLENVIIDEGATVRPLTKVIGREVCVIE